MCHRSRVLTLPSHPHVTGQPHHRRSWCIVTADRWRGHEATPRFHVIHFLFIHRFPLPFLGTNLPIATVHPCTHSYAKLYIRLFFLLGFTLTNKVILLFLFLLPHFSPPLFCFQLVLLCILHFPFHSSLLFIRTVASSWFLQLVLMYIFL